MMVSSPSTFPSADNPERDEMLFRELLLHVDLFEVLGETRVDLLALFGSVHLQQVIGLFGGDFLSVDGGHDAIGVLAGRRRSSRSRSSGRGRRLRPTWQGKQRNSKQREG